MNTYECLQDEACEDGIEVVDYTFESDRIKGLYCDGVVAIREDMTIPEKACALAEEMGHHHTSVGNVLDLEDISNRKQERQARLWAYNKQIGLRGLINAYDHGCQNKYELAEYLEVTDEFLTDCIECYRQKYGIGATVDNYYIMFIPNLTIGKIE
jgi:heterodisulfide reductase subunit B